MLDPTHSIVIRNDDGTYGNATAIMEIREGQSTMNNPTNDVYDLTGRRVEKATKGIYIIGRKKVMVK